MPEGKGTLGDPLTRAQIPVMRTSQVSSVMLPGADRWLLAPGSALWSPEGLYFSLNISGAVRDTDLRMAQNQQVVKNPCFSFQDMLFTFAPRSFLLLLLHFN